MLFPSPQTCKAIEFCDPLQTPSSLARAIVSLPRSETLGTDAIAMDRITVVGTPGAGKTTLAQRIAAVRRIPFVEIDALFWGPKWTSVAPDVFRSNVERALSTDQWTVGGNYGSARDIIWKRADTLIWLDYALPMIMLRLVRRTLRRVITREELWAGNRETWKEQFWSRDSLLLFAVQSHHTRRTQFMHDLARPEYRHLTLIRFRRTRETTAWFARTYGSTTRKP